MALGTNHLTASDMDNFIPQLWEDDTIAAYKSNLVMANRVRKMSHQGKKGDTINIPKPVRGSASSKAAETQVTLVNPAVNTVAISINKHREYSVLIEDIADVQALSSMRRFYTDDAGYAIARYVDWDIHVLGTGLQGGTLDATPGTPDAQTLAYSAAKIGGDGSTAWSTTANTNTGNGSTLTDAGIRTMMQSLDDVDTPFIDRTLVIPPVEKKTLLGIDRFVLWTNVGEAGSANSIRNGKVGDIYGTEVFVSTNCPTIYAADTTTDYRVGMLFHRDAFVLVEQLGARAQSQYKQEYLSDLFTVDTIYGVAELRDDAGVAFVVPA